MSRLFMLSFPSNGLLKDAFLESLDPFSVAISCFEDPLNSTQWIIEALVEREIHGLNIIKASKNSCLLP